MNYVSFVRRCFQESFWWHQRLLLKKGGELLLHRDGSLHWAPTPVPTPTLRVRARPLSPDLLVRSLCEVRCVLLFVWNGEIVCISKVHPLRKMVRESKFFLAPLGSFSQIFLCSAISHRKLPPSTYSWTPNWSVKLVWSTSSPVSASTCPRVHCYDLVLVKSGGIKRALNQKSWPQTTVLTFSSWVTWALVSTAFNFPWESSKKYRK